MNDVWHVMGLKGTGSDSYSVTDLFVPGQRIMTAFGRNPAEKRERGPLYQFTAFQLFGASFASIAHRHRARNAWTPSSNSAKSKTPYGVETTAARQRGDPGARSALAQSQLASARVFLHHALAEMWRGAQPGEITIEQRVQLRMASTHATHQARQVVDAAYHAAGATASLRKQSFERRFRDVSHDVTTGAGAFFGVRGDRPVLPGPAAASPADLRLCRCAMARANCAPA